MLVSANDQSIETACSVESGGLAAGTSEELPHEEPSMREVSFLLGSLHRRFSF